MNFDSFSHGMAFYEFWIILFMIGWIVNLSLAKEKITNELESNRFRIRELENEIKSIRNK